MTPTDCLRRPWPLGHHYTMQPAGGTRTTPIHVVFIGDRHMATLTQYPTKGTWRADHQRRTGEDHVTATGRTPRAAVAALRHLLPPPAPRQLAGDVERRRRRIWLNRRGARRLGVRPGYAYAALVWCAVARRWFAGQIFMDGEYVGGCLDSSGFRLSGRAP